MTEMIIADRQRMSSTAGSDRLRGGSKGFNRVRKRGKGIPRCFLCNVREIERKVNLTVLYLLHTILEEDADGMDGDV